MNRSILGLAAAISMTSGAAAQITVPWYTIDGGGGTSSGGIYTVSGTIGQPDAGVMTGGIYTVTGGFWSAATGTSACNLADITAIGGSFDDPLPPDGQLTVDDIIVFVNFFSSEANCPGTSPCNPADITAIGGSFDDPLPPDGQLTVDDIIVFVNFFSAGC